LSFKHYEISFLPPSPSTLQRILGGDRQLIMTEVLQINADGSAVLGDLLYSDGAVPLSPIYIPSPVRGPSIEALVKHPFFNPIDIGATLAFIDQAGLEPLPQKNIKVSDLSTEEASEEENPDKRNQRHLKRLIDGRSNKIL